MNNHEKLYSSGIFLKENEEGIQKTDEKYMVRYSHMNEQDAAQLFEQRQIIFLNLKSKQILMQNLLKSVNPQQPREDRCSLGQVCEQTPKQINFVIYSQKPINQKEMTKSKIIEEDKSVKIQRNQQQINKPNIRSSSCQKLSLSNLYYAGQTPKNQPIVKIQKTGSNTYFSKSNYKSDLIDQIQDIDQEIQKLEKEEMAKILYLEQTTQQKEPQSISYKNFSSYKHKNKNMKNEKIETMSEKALPSQKKYQIQRTAIQSSKKGTRNFSQNKDDSAKKKRPSSSQSYKDAQKIIQEKKILFFGIESYRKQKDLVHKSMLTNMQHIFNTKQERNQQKGTKNQLKTSDSSFLKYKIKDELDDSVLMLITPPS